MTLGAHGTHMVSEAGLAYSLSSATSGQATVYQVLCANASSSSVFPIVSFVLPLVVDAPWLALAPVPVTLSREPDGWYVLEAGSGYVHGDGPDIPEAIRDFNQCFVEYFELVEAGARRGDGHDAAELQQLGRHLKRVS